MSRLPTPGRRDARRQPGAPQWPAARRRRGRRSWLLGGLLGLILLGLASGVALALPQQQGSVDLLNQANGQWDGPGEEQGGASAGAAVVGLGNVFHRGSDAFAIGAPEANPSGRLSAGSVYVMFNQTSQKPVDLTALAGRGYRIDGADTGDELGFSLAAVTLANGDPGLAVGAPYAGAVKTPDAGEVYVIDLKLLKSDIDLAHTPLPHAVVAVVTGAAGCAELGYSLASSGAWLAAGAPGYFPSGCPPTGTEPTLAGNTGALYALPTKALTGTVALATMGAEAAVWTGLAAGDRTGAAVASAAAVAPGRFLLGAPYASPFGRSGAGEAWLLTAPVAGQTVALSAPPHGTKAIYGAVANDALGAAVATTIGFERGAPKTVDAVIGAPQASPLGRYEAGAAYVVPLTSGNVGLNVKHADVYELYGAGLGDEAGAAVAGLGSINGTGFDSIAIGAPYTNSQTGVDREDNGSAYVLFGGRANGPIDLEHLRGGGFSIYGARNSDEAGSALAALTDANGDGRPALLVGAPFAESAFGATPTEGGDVYAVWGYGTPSVHYRSTQLVAKLHQRIRLAPVIGRTGTASFSVSPGLPRGLSLNRHSGVISGTPRTLASPRFYTVTLTDQAGAAETTLELAVIRRPTTRPRR